MKPPLERQFNLTEKNSAIFIMPRSSKAWLGSEALWITAAGWSAAAKRRFGKAWVITPDRIAQPEEVIHYPLIGKASPQRTGPFFWIPLFFKTLIKDLLLWRQNKNWRTIQECPWANEKVAFVWQQHDLFPGPGKLLADQLNVPLITYVHAPVVWEAARWGVNRYSWGWFLERFIEARSLRQSDVVACTSEEVAEKLVQMGVDRTKILISPMAVDPHLFQQAEANTRLRKELALENKMVIGWTGSFRNFHGLDLLVKAFQEVHRLHPHARLLLVGDGFERKSLEDLVVSLKLSDAVLFAGRQPFTSIPAYVSIFDIAVVSARSSEGFHYSPLKLREYLAAGKPVLAPRVGEIPQVFADNFHLKLYTAGDVQDMTIRLNDLIDNPASSTLMGIQGKKYALETSTWNVELAKLIMKYFK